MPQLIEGVALTAFTALGLSGAALAVATTVTTGLVIVGTSDGMAPGAPSRCK